MVSAVPDQRRQRGLVRARALKLVAAVGALALLWTLVVGWWLPRFAQPRIERVAAEALGVPLSLGRLEIAPWSLGVTVSGLVLGAPDAALLKITRAQADLSVESLWRLAPVLRRLTVTEPHVRIERLAAGRFNFTPVLEALARRPASPPDASPSRFAVHNIRVVDGRIDVFDRVAQGEHHVEALQIGVPFISNLPSQLATDVEPLLDAQIDGSRLHLQGKTQPFAQGRSSTIAIDWQQLDVTQWAQTLTPLLPTPLPLKVTGGELALALQIAFEQRAEGQAPLLRISGGATLSRLQAARQAEGVQLGWERLAVEGLDLQPFAREASVASIRLQAPQVQVDLPAMLEEGAPRPASPKEAPAPAGAASPPATAWQWRVGEVRVDDGGATLRHPAWPEPQALSGLTLSAKQLDSRADAAPASLALGVKDGRGATLALDAAVRIAAEQAQLSARAEGWDVSAWSAPWQPLLPVQTMSGTLSLNVKADVGTQRWAVSEGDATLAGIKLQPAAAPATRRDGADRLDIQRVAVAGFEAGAQAGEAVSLKARSLAIDVLDLKAARSKDGALGWLPRADPRSATRVSPTETSPASVATPATKLRWQLGELRCAACAAAFTDEAVAPTAVVAITRADLTLRGLGEDMSKPIDFELASQWRQGGKLQLRGNVTPQPLALRSRVDVAALDLRMLQPYLRPYVNLELVSAKLDAAGDMSLESSTRLAAAAQAAPPVAAARWRGKLGLNELRTLDSLNQAELVRWKSLQLDGAQLAWRADAPLQADLGSVSLQDFYSRVILNADARLNLLDIAKREGQRDARSLTTPADAGASAPPPADAASAAPSAAARPQLRWKEIAIGGGTVDFTDNFIRPNYSAKLTDLSGTVAALAWDAPQAAAVAVSGKVDGSAPLEISGSMNPLGARLATDITASARGIDITRLTGYAARYAGYGIEKGTLSVKVHYKIAAGQLEADNNLYLDQLTFGDKVDSPNALKLPVQLAVSLLKDRNGVIDLNLPIRGSLDDPQFSIGGVIVKVIVNLITKAITAPFTLLANALGGGSGGPALTHVDFAPGSSELSDAGRAALDTLSKALTDRPALRLEATGHADAAQDQAGLRAQYLDGLMRVGKARSTGELPDSVKIAPAERARWLEAAYKAADFKDKPRNLIGLQKGLPAPEMEALLLANAPASDAALRELADERGNRVKAYLVTKLPPERVLLTASKLDAAAAPPDGLSGPRVDFALK